MLRTRDQLADQAWDDFNFAHGSVIVVYVIDAFRGEDSVVIELDPPVRCRIEDTEESDIIRWLDEWLDPVWNVQPLEQHPALAGTRSWWVFGPSYNVTTGERHDASYEADPQQTTVRHDAHT